MEIQAHRRGDQLCAVWPGPRTEGMCSLGVTEQKAVPRRAAQRPGASAKIGQLYTVPNFDMISKNRHV